VKAETAATAQPFGVRRSATLAIGADRPARALHTVAARGTASRPRPARHLAAIGLVATLVGASGSATVAANEASATTTPGAPSYPGAAVVPGPTAGTSTLSGTRDSGSAWTPRDSCRAVLRGAPQGSVAQTTSAGPNGSTVLPGQTITVTLSWKPTDFSGNRTTETEDCVEIGTRVSRDLSGVHVPGPSGGSDTFSFVVPSGGTGGQPICDRAAVSGIPDPQTGGQGDGGSSGTSRAPLEAANQGKDGNDHHGSQNEGWRKDGTEKSTVLCYSTLVAATPEVANVLLLPLAGLVVGGAALLVVRRRRARAGHPATATARARTWRPRRSWQCFAGSARSGHPRA